MLMRVEARTLTTRRLQMSAVTRKNRVFFGGDFANRFSITMHRCRHFWISPSSYRRGALKAEGALSSSVLCLLMFFQGLCNRLKKLLRVDWLGHESVHPCLEAPITVARQDACGQRIDGRGPPTLLFELANFSRRFRAIQLRHVHVHEHQLKALFLEGFDRLLTVTGK